MCRSGHADEALAGRKLAGHAGALLIDGAVRQSKSETDTLSMVRK